MIEPRTCATVSFKQSRIKGGDIKAGREIPLPELVQMFELIKMLAPYSPSIIQSKFLSSNRCWKQQLVTD